MPPQNANNEDFVKELSRVHYGSSEAVVKLARLLPGVRLVVPVDNLPAPGERLSVPGFRGEDGRIALTCFSSEMTFKRWGWKKEWGTLPALAIFETALGEPFDVLVVDAYGPVPMVLEREVLMTIVNLARSAEGRRD